MKVAARTLLLVHSPTHLLNAQGLTFGGSLAALCRLVTCVAWSRSGFVGSRTTAS